MQIPTARRFIFATTGLLLTVAFLAGEFRSTRAAIGPCDQPEFATIVGAGAIYGTSGDDVIFGSDGPDDIFAGSGNDIVCALDGDDRIYGGSGDDVLDGGLGNDAVDGGSGNDELWGSLTLFGEDDGVEDDDELNGGSGNDILIGSIGTDTLNGGSGDDYLGDDTGDTVFAGGSGFDRCINGIYLPFLAPGDSASSCETTAPPDGGGVG